jgi:hypothetical protein
VPRCCVQAVLVSVTLMLVVLFFVGRLVDYPRLGGYCGGCLDWAGAGSPGNQAE